MHAPLRAIARRLVPAVLATLTGLLPAAAAAASLASHVTNPLIGANVDMANLGGNERELNIAVDPNDANVLAAGANDRGNTGATGQRFYLSTDGGRNWTSQALPTGTLTLDGVADPSMSDPSLGFGSTGEIYYSALMHGGLTDPCTLFVVGTTDQGANWTDGADGVVRAGTQADDECNDKEHIAIDRANNDNVYVAWTPIEGPLDREAVFSRDLNGVGDGFAFSAPQILSVPPVPAGCLNQGADFALNPNVGPSGAIYVAWTTFCSPGGPPNGEPGTVYVVSSTDLGVTWTAPVAAATLENANPPIAAGFRSRSHPSIGLDETTGRIFVVYATLADTVNNDDADIMMVSSLDGLAWTAPLRVNQDAGTEHQVLPWIDVANDRIHVVFSSSDGSNWDTMLDYAPVAPVPTFTEVTLTTAQTPHATGFIGDYHGVITGTDDVVHPAWADGRTGVGGSTDAFTVRVDFSPPSAVDLQPQNPMEEVGNNVNFTATVTGAHGEAEQFIPVEFTVFSSGLPSPSMGSDTTDAAGEAHFSYTNTVAGIDTLQVWADLDEDAVEEPNETVETTVTWTPGPPATLELTPETDTNTVDDSHTVTAHVEDQYGNPTPGITVPFSVSGANEVFGEPNSGSDVTDANGDATFTYIGRLPGDDTISAYADTDNDGVQDPGEPGDTAAKTWLLPPSTPGQVTGGGQISTLTGALATLELNPQLKSLGDTIKGKVQYQDQGTPGRMVRSVRLDALVISGNSAIVFGTATVDGEGSFVFRVDVVDNGEPGGDDTFRLRMSDGYDSGTAALEGGNIQIH